MRISDWSSDVCSSDLKRMYDLEMEHLWRKTWLHACHISEIPNDGSYKLFEQVGLNVIVTRGPGDQVRAFHNICRHRGSRVVLEPTGTAKRFVRSEESRVGQECCSTCRSRWAP